MDREAFLDRLLAQNQFAIKLGLDAMRAAVLSTGLQRVARHMVLVGGTNGKGTTAAALACIAHAMGWRTGLYTSPHLIDFRERIRVDGVPVSWPDLLRIAPDLLDRFDGRRQPAQGDRPLTYFELTTLLALEHFRRAGPLDLAVIEVGLGGRLDATNVLDRDLVVLTGVDLDHQEWLGNTVKAIATEKAALARPGIPCLTTEGAGGIAELERAVRERRGSLERVHCRVPEPTPRERALCLAGETLRHLLLDTSTGPPSSSDLAKLDNAVRFARTRLRWPGRQERRLWEHGTLWLDGAHNAESARASARWLESTREQRAGGLAAVVGLSGDRTVREVLSPLLPLVDDWWVTAPSSRGRNAVEVAQELEALGAVNVSVADAAGGALVHASHHRRDVLVVGSLYLLGDVLDHLGVTADDLALW